MLDASAKMTVLYAQGLATDEQIKQMADVLDQAMKKLGRIEKVGRQAWSMSAAQQACILVKFTKT
jgi:hypothetical protein